MKAQTVARDFDKKIVGCDEVHRQLKRFRIVKLI